MVAVNAYLGGAERDKEMSFIGSSRAPHAVLPGGLPGFEAENSLVYLMPECPRRAEGPYGEYHRLLVGTWAYFAESREEKSAMLRLAVRMTNEMTQKLGCGGEPLPAPKDGAVPDRGTFVSRAQAKGTACDALATTNVPAEGSDGQVRIAIADGGVVGRCTLYAPSKTAEGRQGAARRAGRSSNSPAGMATGPGRYARWDRAQTRSRWAQAAPGSPPWPRTGRGPSPSVAERTPASPRMGPKATPQGKKARSQGR